MFLLNMGYRQDLKKFRITTYPLPGHTRASHLLMHPLPLLTITLIPSHISNRPKHPATHERYIDISQTS
jgi:hypothetical protein